MGHKSITTGNDKLHNDIRAIIEAGRKLAYAAVFQIVQTRLRNLTWSHLCIIASVPHPDAREWYLKEASEQIWSVRTLDRNVSTQYYGRRMKEIFIRLCLMLKILCKSSLK